MLHAVYGIVRSLGTEGEGGCGWGCGWAWAWVRRDVRVLDTGGYLWGCSGKWNNTKHSKDGILKERSALRKSAVLLVVGRVCDLIAAVIVSARW